MTTAQKVDAFRRLHEGLEPFLLPNPWDVGSARVLTSLGFHALATTSAGLAYSLGRRDGEGAVSREEALAHAATIVAATDLPVSADLENGFGDDPEAVAETVRGAAAAGLAGCSIEDSTTRPDDPLYLREEAVERVRAAVEAARSLPVPLVLTARAENHLHGRDDLRDTIARLQAYEEAGADVLYAPGLRAVEDIRAVCSSVSRPVNVLAVRGGPDLATLAAAGVRRVSLGSWLFLAAYGAFLRGAAELRDQGTFRFLDDAASSNDVAAFMTGR